MAELVLFKETSKTLKALSLMLKKAMARNLKIAEVHPSCMRRQQLTELASTWPLLPSTRLTQVYKNSNHPELVSR